MAFAWTAMPIMTNVTFHVTLQTPGSISNTTWLQKPNFVWQNLDG